MTDETMKDAERAESSTAGMTLGERIAHVGGRTNAAGYIEFGSVMAVNALIQQVLRDARVASPQSALSDEQIKQVWKRANGTHPDNGQFGQMVVDFARALLNQASTERMSDAASDVP